MTSITKLICMLFKQVMKAVKFTQGDGCFQEGCNHFDAIMHLLAIGQSFSLR